jgi:glycosyltransferase involved in cell wall biosynthesis
VYPGLFGYPPNDDAALRLIHEVLPAVRNRGYSARIVLAGRNPAPALIAAAHRDAAVEVTGAVESIVPHLEQPCIVTLPIAIGGGTRLKIVEAFAVGRPVVSTTKGAEGIDGVDGEHLFIRDQPEAMASAVTDLWNSPSVRARICQSALDLARGRYSWSTATERIAMSLGLRYRAANTSVGERSQRATVCADGTIH